MRRLFSAALVLGVGLTLVPDLSAQADPRLEALKDEAQEMVQDRAKLVQEIIDHLFSFGELGMQEFETQRYLTDLLADEGFDIELGVAGMPSAWTARWSNGSGSPVIAMGSDVDGIPQSNQKPGVAYRDPILAMAPGHGEGHNSGQAVNIVGALVVKELMERENIDGTLLIWPGVAEEQVASKAFFVREGVFDGVDVNMFTHVSSRFGVNWGQQGGNALWSVQYRFQGETAHSAGSPWRGRSALDAVMLMAQAWEFKREHLRPAARSHYIIVEGGDQPNVVPQFATIWFYFRERDYELTKEQFDAAALMAEGAALMTGTTIDTIMTVGSAWSRHFSKPVAEASFANIQAVGMPEWSEDDIRFAEAFQAEMEVEVTGLQIEVPEEMSGPVDLSRSLGGGSDDIGDISWNMPTVTLGFPSNMSGGPGHNWANGIAMATPIAHKGGVAGAKVQARTLLDLFLDGETVEAAWDYFNDVQTVDTEYIPMIAPTDQPAIFLNEGIMAQWRERMRPFYYDATRFDTYLEQLGIEYPTIRTRPISEDGAAEPEGRGPGGS
ncbi:MAG: peptidase dimerization domain-containing protein [Gemmatimonadales bacterium]|jgi:aminobenzoyl-glutamate utilization protein B|nr:peptidase dimerization domain-containing protein [Gemmatimonadales bacterium]MBT3497444.1 peptidase dimerization domain-containing protein [Gemmatimonadales bacterium]MBT3775871.1 peptidase dimerization domain-containing protein [Gemmatimonadales bacterium]MBT3958402.1 peptidase dimerization domain-containing protein [Gemmatimonadales bacterium]MBT4186268.1 peptidase dimerization domain-containing protein [Gemmatimonadales bacterium]